MRFATDVGVVPVTEIPVLGLAVASLALLVVCVALASIPARAAPRHPTLEALRPEQLPRQDPSPPTWPDRRLDRCPVSLRNDLIDDLSGPFDPTFVVGALSRAGLGRLGREWLLHGHMQDRVGVPMVMDQGADRERTQEVAIEEWMAASPIYSVRMQEALGFRTGDVPAIAKNLQLDIGAPPEFMDFQVEVHDGQHGAFHLPHCGALLDVEPMGEEWVVGMCHTIEDPTFDATGAATSRKVRFRPNHRPPRVPADQTPHCSWRIDIEDENEDLEDHPNRAVLEATRLGELPITALADKGAGDPAEPGGWADYSGDFQTDFQLEDLGHPALQVVLEEVALQSHLLMRGLLLSVSQRYGPDAVAGVGPRVLVSVGGLTAERLTSAMSVQGGGAEALAKVLQVHPVFQPASYVARRISLDGDRVRLALLDAPIWDEGDDLTWLAGLEGPEGLRALDAIAQAVAPQASFQIVRPAGDERIAFEAAVDPSAPPVREQPEVTLARFSGGSTFTFHRMKPTTTA